MEPSRNSRNSCTEVELLNKILESRLSDRVVGSSLERKVLLLNFSSFISRAFLL